jgi:hypothetical protein
MPSPLLVTFVAGERGTWSIEGMTALRGDSLPPTPRIAVLEGDYVALAHGDVWALRGATSNTRYTNRSEVMELSARQPGLSRAEATCAALIPIRKSEAWWALAQDERRAIFEEQSQHGQVDEALQRADIDIGRIHRDLHHHGAEIEALLMRHSNEARALGIRGTPGILVDRQTVSTVADLADLQAAVSKARITN